MTEQNNQPSGKVANIADAKLGPGQAPPPLRPILTVVRQVVIEGDKEAVLKQLELGSLPDGKYIAGNGLFSITVKSAPLEEVTPEWLPVAKQQQAEALAQHNAKVEEQKGRIVSPHTLRPVQ